MGNGMYCDVESYCCEQTDDERLFAESRAKREYLRGAHRRLNLLMKRLAHYKRNPLGQAMCREVEMKISQQTLLIKRQSDELMSLVEQYSRIDDDEDTQASTQAAWEEVMELARLPTDMVFAQRRPLGSSTSVGVAGSDSSGLTMPGTAHSDSPHMSGTTAAGSEGEKQKTFPWQITPPIEDVAELRQKLREMEQSPLFTDACLRPLHKLSMLATGQISPYSMP
ncbi:hypothetical protein GGF43_006376 [Coemansia sp. RSA 2618]|nr:hypothetical protein GGF43_006376 [Coemansia sp. RSA 2618]